MSSEIAIKIEGLGKCYQIYDKPVDRLKQVARPRLQKLVGKQPHKYYREFWALKDITFEVRKGETWGIIGRNGCGKSTLLQIICGTISPTSGSVTTYGRVAALLELGSGFNPEFTGRENVYMNASVLGLSSDEIDLRFSDIAAFAEIGDFIDQPVKTYSSGMMVRLAFAVIAHVDADILVVDEALAVGDAFFTQKCMRFIRKFQCDGGTLLFVSHDTGAVVNLCSKAVLLRFGQIDEIGLPKDVSSQYLASLYESNQTINGIMSNDSSSCLDHRTCLEEYCDMRKLLVNSSVLRNDLEIFQFKYDSDRFGTGEAAIKNVRLLGKNRVPLSWLIGGEDVALEIECVSINEVVSPIIGFQFKDRLGQVIFADNTYLAYQYDPRTVIARTIFVATFEFCFPIVPTGDYSIDVAIASGTQNEHVQHDWVHDALIIRAHASSICHGLVGVPMRRIELRVDNGSN